MSKIITKNCSKLKTKLFSSEKNYFSLLYSVKCLKNGIKTLNFVTTQCWRGFQVTGICNSGYKFFVFCNFAIFFVRINTLR